MRHVQGATISMDTTIKAQLAGFQPFVKAFNLRLKLQCPCQPHPPL